MCGALINLNDDPSFPAGRNIPTLCVLRRSNILSWLKLKDVVLDIGSKYNQRVTMFTSFMFCICLLEMVFFVCSFFKLVTIEISNVFWACGLIDIFTIGSVIMAVIRLGVQINS